NTTRFQTEAIFLENNPDFISKRNLNIKDETETWFIRDRYPFTQLIQEKYLVKEATKECSLQIVEFVSEIFSTSLEVSKKYVDEAIASDNS
ncbi:N-acetyltransferase, partial [Enterococcus faecalis]